MSRARNYIPALKFGHKIYPEDLAAAERPFSDYWYVDGDNGADSGNVGVSVDKPTKTVQYAIDLASAGDVIYVKEKAITDYTGDPTNYAEVLTIPFATSSLSIIGISRGRTQGGLPQLKMGSGSDPHITIQAPGCLIANMGINGYGATGGGILLDDDYATKSAFGTTIAGCHLKNCIPSTATNAATGGAIYTTSAGNAWQLLVSGNRFYKNVGDVVLVGTSNTAPQDWVIEDNIMSGPAANVDCNLYLMGAGDGINGVVINNNIFQQLPALTAGGSNDRFIKATGCVGMLTNNMFGCETCAGGTQLTFETAGTGAFIPTTMHMAGNYGQFSTGTGAGLVSGEIYA